MDIAKVENGLAVTLDSRPLKTPSGNKLHLPRNKRILATLVATEWENQDKILKPHALPVVSAPACQTVFAPQRCSELDVISFEGDRRDA